jgi:hypothetical protein
VWSVSAAKRQRRRHTVPDGDLTARLYRDEVFADAAKMILESTPETLAVAAR